MVLNMTERQYLYELSALAQRQGEILEQMADLERPPVASPQPNIEGMDFEKLALLSEATNLRVRALDFVVEFTVLGVGQLCIALETLVEKLEDNHDVADIGKLVKHVASGLEDLQEHRSHVFKIAQQLESGE